MTDQISDIRKLCTCARSWPWLLLLISFAIAPNQKAEELETLMWSWKNFSSSSPSELKGFRSTQTGDEGDVGLWQVEPMNTPTPVFYIEKTSDLPLQEGYTLKQTSFSSQPDRFALLMYNDQDFADFKLITRFQLVSGGLEQMAGIAFRIRDRNNYYIVRASGHGSNLAFYRFIDGVPTQPVLTSKTDLETGKWYTLSIEAKGAQIVIRLDGKSIMPVVNDTTFTHGKIGFWTKADSVSAFADTRIDYEANVNRFDKALQWAMDENRNLKDGRILTFDKSSNPADPDKKADLLRIVASTQPDELKQEATESETRCFLENAVFTAKKSKPRRWVFLLPLQDHNGEIFAVLRLEMNRKFGSSKSVAMAQALGLAREIGQKTGQR